MTLAGYADLKHWSLGPSRAANAKGTIREERRMKFENVNYRRFYEFDLRSIGKLKNGTVTQDTDRS